MEDLVVHYFLSGLSYKEICMLLRRRHDILINEQQMKRFLNSRNLYRKKYFSDIDDVVDFIASELEGSGQKVGYKWMHKKCLKNGLVVSQERVRLILGILDSEGVERRRKKAMTRRVYYSKGPGFLFHIDGYDKLKPFGICISGCIDGFSRRIIWLRAGPTNNDPAVISG